MEALEDRAVPATFDVTIANDPGTNSAGTTGAAGTLSWALAQANAQAGPHTINIQTDVTLSGPLSPIFNSVTINGNGHTIDAGGTTRIFMVGVDLATMNDPRWAGSIIAERPQVAINDLTLANGLAQGGNGGRRRRRARRRWRAVRQPVGRRDADQCQLVRQPSGWRQRRAASGVGGGGGLGGGGGGARRRRRHLRRRRYGDFFGGGGGGIFGSGGAGERKRWRGRRILRDGGSPATAAAAACDFGLNGSGGGAGGGGGGGTAAAAAA